MPEPVLEASTYESPLTEDTSAYEAASESLDPEPTSHDPLFHYELTSSDAEIQHAETGVDAPASVVTSTICPAQVVGSGAAVNRQQGADPPFDAQDGTGASTTRPVKDGCSASPP